MQNISRGPGREQGTNGTSQEPAAGLPDSSGSAAGLKTSGASTGGYSGGKRKAQVARIAPDASRGRGRTSPSTLAKGPFSGKKPFSSGGRGGGRGRHHGESPRRPDRCPPGGRPSEGPLSANEEAALRQKLQREMNLARRAAVQEAAAQFATGHYAAVSSEFGNFLVPTIPLHLMNAHLPPDQGPS